MLGLCPFHGEKTPSFTVSPVKGIYKCFGCGKAGNAVNFVMEHLRLSYPEALKWLAKKYNIEVAERELSPEEKEIQGERESLFVVMQFAQRYFSDQMLNSDEGRSVGLGYFQQRGLQDAIISKFQLGYSPENRAAFSQAAVKAGYQPKYLVNSGMCVQRTSDESPAEISASSIFDRFAGRVMFPVLDEGGRVVAFGGRTLSSDKKTAKYINSPETTIYHKSRVLYGLWYARKAIQQADSCYLVEGYMDVIAMHAAGVENVVASSGTSLTVEQIRSIHRHTRNIVVLYDGDAAGQKASQRAIPMLLEEGMNVKLLMFPDNDDPDSFSRKVGPEAFREYLQKNSSDFLIYKADQSKVSAAQDPIQKARLIRDLVENIARIPDNIIRSVYIRQCAEIMDMEEQILQNEVNKIRRNRPMLSKSRDESSASAIGEDTLIPEEPKTELSKREQTFDHEEVELLRIMLEYGNVYIEIEGEEEETALKHAIDIPAAEYILFEFWRDKIEFENPLHQMVLDEYVHQYNNMRFADVQHFLNSHNPVLQSFAVNSILNNTHEVSHKWKHFGVEVPSEVDNLKKGIEHMLFSYKEKKLNVHISNLKEKLKEKDEVQEIETLTELKDLEIVRSRVNKHLGRVVVK